MYLWTPNIVKRETIQYANNKTPKPIKYEWKLLCFHSTFKYMSKHTALKARKAQERGKKNSSHETIGWLKWASLCACMYKTIEFGVAMWKNADKSQIG